MEVELGRKRTAVMIILKHEDQFLLLKRFKEPNKDNYTPVGGKLDPYESPIKAAYRETFEETGIKVKGLKYVGSLVESSPTTYNWTCFVYLANIDWHEAPTCNEGILEWISFDRLLEVPTPPTDWFIYQYVLKGKVFAFSAEFDAELNMLEMMEEIEGTIIFKE